MSKKLSPSFSKLIALLNDGEFHDGTTLGEKLAMTRSAIWKAIKKLQDYGISVNSVKGKGYQLVDALILLDKNKIKKLLTEINQEIDILVFESITSTNDFLRTTDSVKSITACLAEQQTQGKGRLNREWYSPFGQNIYLSLRYPFQKDMSELAGLSLVVSLAILSTLRTYLPNDQLFTKWPNDILFAGKKLAGSLIEVQAETNGMCHAVIGIGINVNMINDDRAITQSWTSMRKILGQQINRNELSASLIQHIINHLSQFEKVGFKAFVPAWLTADCLMQQTIILKTINHKVTGQMIGINEQGHLLLKLEDGKTKAFSAGDVSISKTK